MRERHIPNTFPAVIQHDVMFAARSSSVLLGIKPTEARCAGTKPCFTLLLKDQALSLLPQAPITHNLHQTPNLSLQHRRQLTTVHGMCCPVWLITQHP